VKTRDFATNAEVAALVDAFEKASIPASDFTHTAHIAVALSYLETLPLSQALDRMREKIRAFAAHHNLEGLYHETVTTFWMRLLHHVANSYREDSSHLPLWRRINLITDTWGTRRPVERHYSRAVIASKTARERWVAPDRLPIPF
jgi:hypothetical protein